MLRTRGIPGTSIITMHGSSKQDETERVELPDSWWYKVYAAVIVTTIVVITLLYAFSRYFAN